MTIHKPLVTLTCALALMSTCTLAVTAPAELVNQAAQSTPKLEIDPANLDDAWIAWVKSRPWGDEGYTGGAQDFPQRGIVVSVGKASVSVRKGQPGWNESRMMAYAKADLDARSRLVGFLEQKLTSGRKFELIGNTEFNDGQIHDMRDISELSLTLERWGKKTVRLTDATLDKLIGLLDEGYDAATFNALLPERQKVVVEEMYNQAVKRVLALSLNGVATVYTTEGSVENEYQVLVGIIWSPKLDRTAWNIRNDAATAPVAAPGMNINAWVNGLGTDLLMLWGNRVLVDEKGHYNVLAFAQAEPARSATLRKQRALDRAKDIAENRARALITDFVTETIVLSDQQSVRELYQELEDTSSATQITRKLRKVVEGRRKTLTIKGLRTLKRWSMTHPETGQKVAGAVVAWSSSSREMARRMSEAMQHSTTHRQPEKEADTPQPQAQGSLLKPVTIDTSAY